MGFTIQSMAPTGINEAAKQPDLQSLSLTELRICFSERIALLVDGAEVIVLEEAPVIGAMLDFVDALHRLSKSSRKVEVVDFYGEYVLVFHETAGVITCKSEFTGEKIQVSRSMFKTAIQIWSEAVLTEIEACHHEILQNSEYQQVKKYMVDSQQTGVKYG